MNDFAVATLPVMDGRFCYITRRYGNAFATFDIGDTPASNRVSHRLFDLRFKALYKS
jgi:hypothetical protein